ncbi:cAMP-dependent protein kinase catalytic subunit 1-like [Galendromus occidentalis]|uniref:Serine/threonine-protein kinase greatwall n=1 Tax=Galendromus occidentalis TaxID=34638 RepID=A0AAJ6QQW3_9ACAR|nr:cAMP-dependent protein kinase catalytic subunit 1-like [Galendromus occidentalis]
MSQAPDDSQHYSAKSCQEIIDDLTKTIDSALSTHGESTYELSLSQAGDRFQKRYVADSCPRAALSDFEYGSTLGAGSFGAVYLARYKDGTICALKHQKLKWAVKERKITYALKSPFIVEALYAFQKDDIYYIAYELASWGDLSQHRKVIRASGSEELLKLISAQLVLALEYMQHCQVAHQDLKSNNVGLFADGYVKILDFGLGEALAAPKPVFRMQGKKKRFAPEKVKALLVSAHFTDWWNLGSLINDLLPSPEHIVRIEFGKSAHEADLSHLRYPKPAGEHLTDLLVGLQKVKVTERLGAMKDGAKDVKNHPWFSDVNFIHLYYKTIPMLEKYPEDMEWVDVASGAVFTKDLPKLMFTSRGTCETHPAPET